ncbi:MULTISPECIES: hypothetical protein [Heyndrickxia]|jgi:hypothetical protein|uniref:Uncharacterized protein n=1 Tax=Heyndrickxia oleronia TaxID=38875 RepID=A0AAW6SSD9_9BACI|nr:hypothetical protein [Heyndrickxia oleronia]MDH5159702.1 hypothetical protein [Heyndrickxia oleronia]MEC1376445.1 hypothetical protein [Heyndrickxia oleronia]GIN40446.1 hypothetical protein J19TS1_33950 [Heyndrickxia oleronia]
MWIRFIPIVFFSATAIMLFAFQSVEIVHAVMDLIFSKTRIK